MPLKSVLNDLLEFSLRERSAEARANKKMRRGVEVTANPRGFPKTSVGSKPIDTKIWPHNKVRRFKFKPKAAVAPEMGERSPEARAKKAFRRKDVPLRPAHSGGSPKTPLAQTDVLPAAPGLVARAARHKKAGIESPLLMRMRQKRNALQPKGEELTYEELQMSEHAILNEETGELEVSDEVTALLDGMVEVLESAGYDIESGMDAEEFVEQVGEVLETDEDLEGSKKEALQKSHKTVMDIIAAAHEAVEMDEADDDDADDAEGDDDAEDDKDDKDDKKPFFLKKKAKKAEKDDEDADEDDDAEEAVESDEQEESSIAQHTMKHAAQKGYSPGWSAHKAGKPGTVGKNAHGSYTVNSVRPNKGPKHMGVKKARV